MILYLKIVHLCNRVIGYIYQTSVAMSVSRVGGWVGSNSCVGGWVYMFDFICFTLYVKNKLIYILLFDYVIGIRYITDTF